MLQKYLLAPPSGSRSAWGLVIGGLLFIALGFLFQGPEAHVTQFAFTCAGLANIAVAATELLRGLPMRLVVALRIAAGALLACAVGGLIALYVGIGRSGMW